MTASQVRGIFGLSRPGNAIGAGLLTGIGVVVAGGASSGPTNAAVAVLATSLAVAAGNTINDYVDREIDRINEPDRPIPRGAVSPTTALWVTAILFTVAGVLTLTLPATAIAIATLNLFLLLTYTTWFKGTVGAGNVVVAYLVGSTFVYGGAAVGNATAVLELAVLAALATFAREVLKDVEDIDGDRASGLTTIPIRFGERAALVVGSIALLAAVAVSPLPYLSGTTEPPYLVLVGVANAIAIVAVRESLRNVSRGQRLTKIAMFVALVAFAVGGLSGS